MEINRLTSDKTTLLRELQKCQNLRDEDFVFVTSAQIAMRDRPKDALPVIYAEPQEHLVIPTYTGDR